jgi:hypothetical protein
MPAWVPRSWHRSPVPRADAGGSRWSEELDVDPRALARRIRAHQARGGRGLIDFDAPGEPGEPGEVDDPGVPGGPGGCG